jgi:hypothetical protein
MHVQRERPGAIEAGQHHRDGEGRSSFDGEVLRLQPRGGVEQRGELGALEAAVPAGADVEELQPRSGVELERSNEPRERGVERSER